MFNNRSRWFDATHAIVKQGYEDYSTDLIENVLLSLRRNELNDSQREYLIGCLDNLLHSKKPEHSFYLKNERGVKKKATALRDIQATVFVVYGQKHGMKYEDALRKTARAISKMFPEAPYDYKMAEKAFIKHKEKVLKDWEEIEPNITPL